MLSHSVIVLITIIVWLGMIQPGSAQIVAFNSKPSEINWVPIQEALGKARAQKKFVLIAFHIQGCPYCKKMKETVYRDAEMQKRIEKYFIPVEIDLEHSEEFLYKGRMMSTQSLAEIFKVEGTPTLTFLNEDGDLIAFQPGYLNSNQFEKLVEYVGTGIYATLSFDEFLKN